MKQEESLQIAVSSYLKLQYPDIIFTAESSGIRLTKSQAGKAKMMRSGKGLPDMIILAPRKNYHGLCLELKAQSPFKKNGELLSDPHLEEQQDILSKLQDQGYCAEFVTGFDEAKQMIDAYFGPPSFSMI